LAIETFKQKFKLVDCWHLRDRNQEQIEQSFREMTQFINSVVCSIKTLQLEINAMKSEIALSTESSSDPYLIYSYMFLKSQEIRRLKKIRDNAFHYTHFYRKDVITEEIFTFLDDEEEEEETDEDNVDNNNVSEDHLWE
jgi:hypothetical protein